MHTVNPPEDENASTMVVALGLDVSVGHKKHGEDDDDDIPSRQNQTWGSCQILGGGNAEGVGEKKAPYLKVSATEPIFSGACQAEKATIAGT
jgi:hypothetical protein